MRRARGGPGGRKRTKISTQSGNGTDMKVYLIANGLDGKGRNFDWSETTKLRKPDPTAVRWYVTDNENFPLGPVPQEVKDAIAGLWAVTYASTTDLPKYFNRLDSNHFSGLQAVDTQLGDLFRHYAGQEVELIRIPKMWSLTDKAEITTPYFLANVYGAEPTIDLDRSKVFEVINSKYSRSHRYAVSGAVEYFARIRRGFQTARHVWRDSNTSDWFCDDAFRTAAEQVSPRQYSFDEMAED